MKADEKANANIKGLIKLLEQDEKLLNAFPILSNFKRFFDSYLSTNIVGFIHIISRHLSILLNYDNKFIGRNKSFFIDPLLEGINRYVLPVKELEMLKYFVEDRDFGKLSSSEYNFFNFQESKLYE